MDIIPVIQVVHTFQILFSKDTKQILSDICRELQFRGDLNNFIFPLETEGQMWQVPPPLSEVNSYRVPWDQELNADRAYFFLLADMAIFEEIVALATRQPVDLRPMGSLPQFHTHITLGICWVPGTDLLYTVSTLSHSVRDLQLQVDVLEERLRSLRGTVMTMAQHLMGRPPTRADRPLEDAP